jgi:hypothetical protein
MATSFVDRVVLHVEAGNGGHGVASVHREKFKPLGGPTAATAGNGGDVVLVVDPRAPRCSTTTAARTGAPATASPGAGDERNGAHGEDLVLPVPEGTVVKTGTGTSWPTCRRGHRARRGAGRPRRPGQQGAGLAAAQGTRLRALGEPGESAELVLELKSLADVGLVGFPSAGKSSLVSVLSAARPKIADYPFTTLVPNLGVVTAGAMRFTIADVPGLIPGASEGKGPRPGVPPARRALLGARPRRRLRDARAGPRPDDRPRRHRGRARRLRRRRRPRRDPALRAHPGRRAQQGRRARGPRARRDGHPDWRSAGSRSSSSAPSRTRGSRS